MKASHLQCVGSLVEDMMLVMLVELCLTSANKLEDSNFAKRVGREWHS